MANKKKENRSRLSLRCEECGNFNYTTQKNSKNTQGKLEIKKYCPHCRKTTVHKEHKM